jgi:hypothetical protein
MLDILSPSPNLGGKLGMNAPTGRAPTLRITTPAREIKSLAPFAEIPFLIRSHPPETGIGRNTDRTKNDLSVFLN